MEKVAVKNNSAIAEAVRIAGGQSALAAMFSPAVNPQAVQQWVAAGICPVARVLCVESFAGVSRYRLRPDIYGEDPDAVKSVA